MPMFVAPIAGALSDRIGGRPHHGDRARAAGGRARLDRGGVDGRRRVLRRSSGRSSSPASGWRCSSRRSPTSSCRPVAGRRRARPPGRTTRSARSAACSASPSWRRSSSRYGGYESPETFNDGIVPALWVGAAVLAAGCAARAGRALAAQAAESSQLERRARRREERSRALAGARRGCQTVADDGSLR